MRLLLVSPQAPTGVLDGLQLPLRQLLDRVRRLHDVTLLTYRTPDHPDPPGAIVMDPAETTTVGRLVEAGVAVSTRSLVSARHLTGLAEGLRAHVESERPDLVHVFSGPLAGLVGELDGVPAVLTAMDARTRNLRARADMARGPRRLWLRDEERRYRRYQQRWYPLFDSVVLVTDPDAAIVRHEAAGTRTAVIPNGVAVPPDDGTRRTAGAGPTVLFHGALSYAPNILAVKHLVTDVWPRVRRARPDATLVLVGRNPASEVHQLSRADGVNLVGEVEDVWPWLRGADVYVCPMTSGTGIKNKLLEAMGAGRPCVVSPLATQGLAVVDDSHLLVRTDADATARAVVELFDAPAERTRLGEAAAAYVAAAHSWDAFERAYTRLYDEVLRTNRAVQR